jgi:hypothetical protein
MEYQILIEKYKSIQLVHTILSGQMDELSRDKIALETVNVMRKENISDVIWDIREIKLQYSLLKSHLVVINIANLGFLPADHLAVVYLNDTEQHQHASNVAANRFHNIRYFYNNLDEAREWLSSFYNR